MAKVPEFNEAQRLAIVQALATDGANLPCPACGNPRSGLLEKFVELPSVPNGFVVCVATSCHKCGHVALFAAAHVLRTEQSIRDSPPG